MHLAAGYDEEAVRGGLGTTALWRDVRVVAQTGSTSSDLAGLARAGAPEGTVVVADHQVTGRGRLDRSWHTPPGTGIAVSVLLRPTGVPVRRWTWLPLLVGVAVTSAVAEATGLRASLKWPNDVLLGGRKLAGILAEVVPGGDGAVVVGIGLNVTVAAADLPEPATSLLLAGAPDADRLTVLTALLGAVEREYLAWRATGGQPDGVGAAYRPLCATLGATVRVTLPTGAEVTGEGVDVDDDGRLVVRTATGRLALSVGDVVHVRQDGRHGS